MKLATRTIRLLLDRPNDPAIRGMALAVIEQLEALTPGFYPEEPSSTPAQGIPRPPASTAATPVRTAALDLDAPRGDSMRGAREVSTARGSSGYGYNWAPGKELQIPVPEEMSVLHTIKDMRLQGVPYRRIADRLNAAGVPSRSKRLWNLAMVKIQWMRLQDSELSAAVENFQPLDLTSGMR